MWNDPMLRHKLKMIEDFERTCRFLPHSSMWDVIQRIAPHQELIEQVRRDHLWINNFGDLYERASGKLTREAISGSLGGQLNDEMLRLLDLQQQKLAIIDYDLIRALSSAAATYASLLRANPVTLGHELRRNLQMAQNAEKLFVEGGISKLTELQELALPSRVGIENAAILYNVFHDAGEVASILAGVGLRELADYERYCAQALKSLAGKIEDSQVRILQEARLQWATSNIDQFTGFISSLAKIDIAQEKLYRPKSIRPFLQIRPNFHDVLESETNELDASILGLEKPPRSPRITERTVALIENAIHYDSRTAKPFFARSSNCIIFAAKLPQIIVTNAESCGQWALLLYKFFVEKREQDYKKRLEKPTSLVIDDILLLRAEVSHDVALKSEEEQKRFVKRLEDVYCRRTGEARPTSQHAWIRLQESIISGLETLLESLHSELK